MPKLPSFPDVGNVSPTIARDPGVSAPVAAFQSPIGIAAQELAPAAERLAQIAIKQENRRDTVDRAGKINQKERDGGLELSRLNTEEDLSNEQVLGKFGLFLSERNKAIIEEHRKQGASEDSLATLSVRLNDIDSDLIGKASGISVKLGREKVSTTFNDSLSPLTLKASQNPTLENIDGLFLGLETRIGDIRAALDPSEEENFRRIGREQIVLSAVDNLVTRGRIDSAESLLDDGGLFGNLSADKQREVLRKIETVRSARDNVLTEIVQAEKILGRPLTQEERLIKLGLASKQALTERQRRSEGLQARGLSPNLADDIAANDVKVMGPDPFGNFYRINVVTNESEMVTGSDAEQISKLVADAKRKQAGPETKTPTKTKLEGDVEKGIGPFANIQAGISNFIGPFMEGAVFKDTTDSRQSLKIFAQTAKTALVNNPKFPVAEQNIVRELLPDVDKFFIDPDRSRSDLAKMKEFLIDSRESKTKELGRGKITSDRKGDLTDQISRIEELLTLMETPAEKEAIPRTNERGWKLMRDANGNQAYVGPNGEIEEVR